jgi:hypothetical protein
MPDPLDEHKNLRSMTDEQLKYIVYWGLDILERRSLEKLKLSKHSKRTKKKLPNVNTLEYYRTISANYQFRSLTIGVGSWYFICINKETWFLYRHAFDDYVHQNYLKIDARSRPPFVDFTV